MLNRLIFLLILALCLNPAWAKPTENQGDTTQTLCIKQTDFPIHEEIVFSDDSELCFDNPEGQIITSAGILPRSSQKNVAKFYQKTLPQLGWVPQSEKALQFVREQQVLTIHFKEDRSLLEDQVIIVFNLKPQETPPQAPSQSSLA